MDPAAKATSARLLRVAASLVPLLDLEGGTKARTLAPLVEELQEVLDDQQLALDEDVRLLLTSAVTSIASPSPTIPYSDCLSAHFGVARALFHLSTAPAFRPSPFSRLSAELVARIVDACQDDEPRLRQNTNLTLSRTCRAFHRAAQPYLAAEIHVFTAGQLERVEARARDLFKEARLLSFDLALADIQRHKDGRWAGRRLPLLLLLTEHIPALRVKLSPDLGSGVAPAWQAMQSLGVDESEWDMLFNGLVLYGRRREVHVPCIGTDGDNLEAILEWLCGPSAAIRSLRIGHDELPTTNDPAQAARYLQDSRAHPATPGQPRHDGYFSLLAIPYLGLSPSDLLPLISLKPPPPGAPSLEHLEVCIFLHGVLGPDVRRLASILTAYAPSLRRLTLRLRRRARGLVPEAVASALAPAFARCRRLEHLAIGGSAVEAGLIEDILRANLPLRTFTLLPTTAGVEEAQLPTFARLLPDSVQRFAIYWPDVPSSDPAAWGESHLHETMGECEDRKIKLVLEDRAVEAKMIQKDVE
ncbi:hypothetical protein JCM10213_006593 [Rhodosporidiobolus nylandii]